jgi:hypothetical protein
MKPRMCFPFCILPRNCASGNGVAPYPARAAEQESSTGPQQAEGGFRVALHSQAPAARKAFGKEATPALHGDFGHKLIQKGVAH